MWPPGNGTNSPTQYSKYIPKMKKYLTIVACFATLTLQAQLQFNLGKGSPLQKMQVAEMAIKNLYVDSVNENKLVEDAIKGMLEQLDPHSSYSSAKETKAMNESLQGSFEGIGVQFNIVKDTLLIIQTIVNGPSEKVGIMAGDRIVSVNDSAISGVKMSREDIVRRLRGPKGTLVKVGVVRPGIKDVLTFRIKRDKIPIETVDAYYLIRPGVAYIRIGSFGATTYEEFMQALMKLQVKGATDLILDLQDNGGGYLQAAVSIVNEFLQRNDLIVYTQGRNTSRQEFRAHGNGGMLTGKVFVLINEYSASAAEIVTGAIQDQDRGIVVGRRSFGKGLVQRPIEFADGSMMRLTIAHYYTPSGRCIQKPYVKGDNANYEKDLDNRFKKGEFYSADSIHLNDSLKYQTLRRKRTVYGGGGIMPDYFVPLDSTQFTHYHRQLAAKSIIINANIQYVDKHRKELKKKYPTFAEFNKKYQVPQTLINEIVAEGEKQKIKAKNQTELNNTIASIKTQLKALVARDLWHMSEYFQVMNESNHVVQKALVLLGKDK
jgi:peptidase, S41 family